MYSSENDKEENLWKYMQKLWKLKTPTTLYNLTFFSFLGWKNKAPETVPGRLVLDFQKPFLIEKPVYKLRIWEKQT